MFLSIVQAVMEVLNKSHFSLQMGNCLIPVAKHSGPYAVVLHLNKRCEIHFAYVIFSVHNHYHHRPTACPAIRKQLHIFKECCKVNQIRSSKSRWKMSWPKSLLFLTNGGNSRLKVQWEFFHSFFCVRSHSRWEICCFLNIKSWKNTYFKIFLDN